MPVLEREGTQVWHRRTTGESLIRWFGWLLGVAVSWKNRGRVNQFRGKDRNLSAGRIDESPGGKPRGILLIF